MRPHAYNYRASKGHWRRQLQHALLLCASVCIFPQIGLSQSSGSVSLAWDRNTESDLAGYFLHYGPAPGLYTSKTNVGLRTTNTVSGLVEGATYYFVVTAYNSADLESEPSNEVTNIVSFASGGPIISQLADVIVNEDTTFTVPFTIYDPNTPAAALTLTARSANPLLISPASIIFEGIGANRSALVVPSTNGSGATTVTFVVGDGLRTAESSFTVTVNPVNDPLPAHLSIATATNFVLISWPTSVSTYQIERLHSSNWEVETQPAQLLGTNRVLTVRPTNAASFYRLRRVD